MNIRKGAPDDLDELESLYNELNDYLEANINYPGWIKHIYPVRETAEQAIKSGDLYVLEIDSKIAGSVILSHEPEDAYGQVAWGINANYSDIIVIRTLVVHPLFMSEGIGVELMAFAERYAQQKKMKAIRLDVSLGNLAAISLYEKLGYKYMGTVDLGLPYEHLKWFRLYELLI
jgi:Acetyltransferases